MPKYMKVAEAVAESGLSRAHVYRLIDQGKVPSQTEGRLRKVDVEALKRFISESASKPRRGRRPGSGKAALAAKAAKTQATTKAAPKAARKTTKKTTRKAATPKTPTRKAAVRKTPARTAAPRAAKAPAAPRSVAPRSVAPRKSPTARRPAAPKPGNGAGELAFLRAEVDRLWAELELRRADQQAESDRLLKIIESLTRRA